MKTTRHHQNLSLGLDAGPESSALSSATYILALAAQFPTLKRAAETLTGNWDIDRFMKMTNGSDGEVHAARFIAQVWNPGYAKTKRWNFDLMAALGCWDSLHQQAFQNWVNNPFWP